MRGPAPRAAASQLREEAGFRALRLRRRRRNRPARLAPRQTRAATAGVHYAGQPMPARARPFG